MRVIPIASSPQRTDERPTSHADSTTVCGHARHEVDVVAEQRAVGEFETREQRVVDGVPTVRGDVEHVDRATPGR